MATYSIENSPLGISPEDGFATKEEFFTYVNFIKNISMRKTFSPKVIGFLGEGITNLFTQATNMKTDTHTLYSRLTDLTFDFKGDFKEGGITVIRMKTGHSSELENELVKCSQDKLLYAPIEGDCFLDVIIGNFCGVRDLVQNQDEIKHYAGSVAISSFHDDDEITASIQDSLAHLSVYKNTKNSEKIIDEAISKLKMLKRTMYE